MTLTVAVIDAVWIALGGWIVDWRSLGSKALFVGLVLLVLAIPRYRRDLRIRSAAAGATLLLVFLLVGAIFSYLVVSTNAPLVDEALSRADVALGFDWIAVHDAIARHPWLAHVLQLIYLSGVPQMMLVVLALAALGRPARMDEFLRLFIVACLITIVASALLPAAGAWKHYGPAALSAPATLSHFEPLRDGMMRFLPLGAMQGLISVPSLHSAMALLLVWSVRGTVLLAPMAVLNGLMLASTPTFGGHYLIDVIAGMGVAFAVVAIDRPGDASARRPRGAAVADSSACRTVGPVHPMNSRATTARPGEPAWGSHVASSANVEARRLLRRLGILFFASGVPALLYQLVWQRALFRIFGVNVESVTIVVAAFMLGLGLGGLAGGWLSRQAQLALLPLLAAIEALTALFGVVSITLFERVGDALAGAALPWVAVASLALVLVPTLLMGATLPLLVGHLARRSGSVGHALGMLYHVNTLGAATACLVAAVIFFPLLGMRGTVLVAVAINAGVALGALTMHRRVGHRHADRASVRATAPHAWTAATDRFAPTASSNPVDPTPQAAIALDPTVVRTPPVATDPGGITGHVAGSPRAAARPRFGVLLALAAAGGFVALSWEMFFFRAMSLASGSSPLAFAITLGAFLVGLASGSRAAAQACDRLGPGVELAWYASRAALAACVVGAVFLPLFSFGARLGPTMLGAGVLSVYLLSRWWGTMLPCLAHLGVRADERAGMQTGWLMLANVGGSTAGTVLTGFVLMDHLGLVQLAQACVGAGLLCSLAIVWTNTPTESPSPRGAGHGRVSWTRLPALTLASTALVTAAALPILTPRLFETLQWRADPRAAEPFAAVVENRAGVIAVTRDGTVFGHGAYDGAFSTDLVHDVNGIVRPFALSLFHPEPRDVLMIGLSSGSWAQVIANHPQVSSLTIVEINPGYVSLIAGDPRVSPVLRHPKVTIVHDDGRRWLRRHPDRRYDAIVTNTTYHHRANATNLLSAEYVGGLRRHLKPRGIVFYNTTDSSRVQRTGCLAYAHGARFLNHIVLSDTPLDWDADRWRRILLEHRIDGRAVVDPARSDDRAWLAAAATMRAPTTAVTGTGTEGPIEPCPALLARTAGLAPITDDNMGTEWTHRRDRP